MSEKYPLARMRAYTMYKHEAHEIDRKCERWTKHGVCMVSNIPFYLSREINCMHLA